MNEKTIARFWKRVDKNGPVIRSELGPCWIWKRIAPNQYGRFFLNGKQKPATHFALALIGIDVPSGFQACHKCDNPPCVRSDHLFIGTAAENISDSVKRGRRAHIRGENSNHAVLTAAQVIEIRERYATTSGKKLAEEFGVRQSAISAICSGKCWKNVGGPLTQKPVPSNRKLTPLEVSQIRQRLIEGKKRVELMKEFNICRSSLDRIRRNESYETRSTDISLPIIDPRRKLTFEQAEEIRRRLTAGESYRVLSKEFNIGKTALHRIRRFQSYKSVHPQFRRSPAKSHVPPTPHVFGT